jgi:lauroyl/myristoyl acyltransferase
VSPAPEATPQPKGLGSPHKRGKAAGRGFRPIEKLAISAYRTGMWLMSRLPVPVARAIVSFFLQLSFVLVPSKRRSINVNFAHILGKSPSSLEVKRKAYGAFRAYARYVVELMRLPRMTNEEAGELVDSDTLLPLEAYWRSTGKGLILTTAHIGNLEGVARGVAHHGWPVTSIGDDSAFPELFELLSNQRKSWGVTMIPWRNLRGIYGVLKRQEILALVVDWGYRADDVPVRMFGAWTTLPIGPAALAAKTGAPIVHMAIRRTDDGDHFQITYTDPIIVASSDDAEIRRATQAVADGLAATIAAAPEDWYSFKAQWPATAEEQAALEARAARMDANRGEPRPAAAPDAGSIDGAAVAAAGG